MRRFKAGQCRVAINQKDADLWGKLATYVTLLGPLLHGVGKVVSHQDIQGAMDEAEEWIFQGNAAADAMPTRLTRDFLISWTCGSASAVKFRACVHLENISIK